MPVQMIELEEVTMEISDEAIEAIVVGEYGLTTESACTNGLYK